MKQRRWRLTEAYKWVKEHRPETELTPGMQPPELGSAGPQCPACLLQAHQASSTSTTCGRELPAFHTQAWGHKAGVRQGGRVQGRQRGCRSMSCRCWAAAPQVTSPVPARRLPATARMAKHSSPGSSWAAGAGGERWPCLYSKEHATSCPSCSKAARLEKLRMTVLLQR